MQGTVGRQTCLRGNASIPDELKKTLIWDQDSEMTKDAGFELATPFKVYFCNPHLPWEHPSNEDVNGLIREFFPKSTRLSEVIDEEVVRRRSSERNGS